MAKKRQQDFHKTKLRRPGKRLALNSRNATNTAFKAKKVIVLSQNHKKKSELTIPECIKASSTGTVLAKGNSLNRLQKLLIKEEDFSTYLPDIFEAVDKNVQHSEEDLRNASVKVLETVLKRTDATKINSFFPRLTKILSFTMTHVDIKVKQISLTLLDILLKTHPHLLCTSSTILTNLLRLLLRKQQSYNTKSRKAVQKSNLLVSCGDSFYSQNWRIQVIAHMSMFLKAMLENLRGDTDKIDDTENEVYWDGESPLYIEIFAGGGLKPVGIEKTASFLRRKENDFEDPDKVQLFVTDIIDALSPIFIEEIFVGSKTDDDLFLKENLNNLSILLEVMCYLGEWVKLINDTDSNLEKSFTKDLHKFFRNIKTFPFIPKVFIGTKFHGQQHLPCVRLNLSICYLYSAFILRPDSSADDLTIEKDQVLNYIDAIFEMAKDIRYECIPMLLKIAKIYLSLSKISTGVSVIPRKFMRSVLTGLCRILDIKEGSNIKILISFFIELSLQVDDEYMVNSDTWFTHLLKWLKTMCKGNKIDRKFLKDIRRISVLKHSLFQDCLEKMSMSTFKDLLTHANEDVSDTAVFLIYHKREVSNQFLIQLSDLILTDSGFHPKKAFKLIRLLTHRFSEPSVPAEDRVNFTTFLLNIALDTINLDERWADYDISKFTSIWSKFGDGVPVTIYPSLHWGKHSKLFEVCHKSLNRLPSYTVNKIAFSIINEIMVLGNRRELPVHCVIAILSLKIPVMTQGPYKDAMENLVNSVLMFLSVMTNIALDDEWYKCNVNPLMDCLSINRHMAEDFIFQMDVGSHTFKSGIEIFYIMKVMKFLYTENLFYPEDGSKLMSLLETYKKNCKETDISQQPLYNKLYNLFYYL